MVVGAVKVDAAEIWTEGVASTSKAANGLELRAGVAKPEVATGVTAGAWEGGMKD